MLYYLLVKHKRMKMNDGAKYTIFCVISSTFLACGVFIMYLACLIPSRLSGGGSRRSRARLMVSGWSAGVWCSASFFNLWATSSLYSSTTRLVRRQSRGCWVPLSAADTFSNERGRSRHDSDMQSSSVDSGCKVVMTASVNMTEEVTTPVATYLIKRRVKNFIMPRKYSWSHRQVALPTYSWLCIQHTTKCQQKLVLQCVPKKWTTKLMAVTFVKF